MAATEAILKFFKRLLLNPKFDWAETWWEASQWHRDSKLSKSFCSDIQNGRQGGHLKILQTTSPPKPKVRLNWNLMGGITVTQKFKIAKIFPFRYPRWPPLGILQTSGWAEFWWETSEWNGDSELLNHSVPVSKMTAMVAILNLFKQHQILNC